MSLYHHRSSYSSERGSLCTENYHYNTDWCFLFCWWCCNAYCTAFAQLFSFIVS